MTEDEGKRNDEVARGKEAQQILNNRLFQEAKSELTAWLTQQWANTDPNATTEREHLYRMVQAVWLVHNTLTEHVRTGQMAEEQLRQMRGQQRPDW